MDIIHTCAQSYFASTLKITGFQRSYYTLLRTLLGAFRACPAPRRGAAVSSKPPYHFGHAGRVTLPLFRGFALLPWVIRPARRAGPTSWSRQARPLPWFRADGGYSVPLLAAQSRHEKPHLPISKIKCRLAFGRQDGNSMPHSPAQRKRDFGKLKFCARGAEVDERRETIDASGDKKT